MFTATCAACGVLIESTAEDRAHEAAYEHERDCGDYVSVWRDRNPE